jgi:hypothetical protein
MQQGVKPASSTTAKRPRDLRLDFFRGLAMLIIFIAHVPGNAWNNLIPARFGFSNATEIFVFSSGFASAIAFGAVFARRGWLLGAARIAHRCWQVYWAHIGLFLSIMALYFAAHAWFPAIGYIENQGFDPLLREPGRALIAMMTLRWQADYLDILPMYLVILALVPLMMLARRAHPLLPFGLSLALYGAVHAFDLSITGDPWNERPWYFNPFAWQLIFFTGFAFGAKWLPAAPLNRGALMLASAACLLAALPLAFFLVREWLPALQPIHEWLLPAETQQTNLHPLRYLHFLALAYVALSLVDRWRARIGDGWTRHVVKVGQQSLATFMASLFLARLAGLLLDQAGRDLVTVSLVNLAGLAGVVLVAHVVGWFKGAPWNGPGPDRAPEAAQDPLPGSTPRVST